MGSFPTRRSPVRRLVPADQHLQHMQVSILLRGVDGTVSQAYVQRKLGNVTKGRKPGRAATAIRPVGLVRPSPHRYHRCGGSFMSCSLFKLPIKLRVLAVVGCIAAILAPAACSSGGSSGSNTPGVVTVAVVANPLITGQMVPLTRSVFEKQYPGIKVKFVTYTEGDLRAAIERDVSTHSNAFNVIMIGPYETPLFAKNGWLVDMSKQFFPQEPELRRRRSAPAHSQVAVLQGRRVRGAVLRRVVDGVLPQGPVRQGAPDDAAAPDLGAGPDVRGQAQPARQGRRESACAAWQAGATTWPRSTRSSTPSAASGST